MEEVREGLASVGAVDVLDSDGRSESYADALARGPPRPTYIIRGSFEFGFNFEPCASGATQPATCAGTEEPLLVTMRVSQQEDNWFKWEFVKPGGHALRLVSEFLYPRRNIEFGLLVDVVTECSQRRARCVTAFCKSTGISRRCQQSIVSENDFLLLAESVPADDSDGRSESHADALARAPPRPTYIIRNPLDLEFYFESCASGATQPATCAGTEEPRIVIIRVPQKGDSWFKWEFVTPGGHALRLLSEFFYPRRNIEFGLLVDGVTECSQRRARCVTAFCRSTGISRRCQQSIVSENDFLLLAESVPADVRDSHPKGHGHESSCGRDHGHLGSHLRKMTTHAITTIIMVTIFIIIVIIILFVIVFPIMLIIIIISVITLSIISTKPKMTTAYAHGVEDATSAPSSSSSSSSDRHHQLHSHHHQTKRCHQPPSSI